jgi:hypothetical protein
MTGMKRSGLPRVGVLPSVGFVVLETGQCVLRCYWPTARRCGGCSRSSVISLSAWRSAERRSSTFSSHCFSASDWLLPIGSSVKNIDGLTLSISAIRSSVDVFVDFSLNILCNPLGVMPSCLAKSANDKFFSWHKSLIFCVFMA